ncbi:Putative ribonuclease H protein family [Arachis hypogaea]|nr:Putative ribonuclease H protein family [Arachis hypogaea]
MGNNVRTGISEALGFPRTNDLGKYLGVLLLRSRVTKNTYHEIIQKLNTRLSNWKASSLFLAGRITLVIGMSMGRGGGRGCLPAPHPRPQN